MTHRFLLSVCISLLSGFSLLACRSARQVVAEAPADVAVSLPLDRAISPDSLSSLIDAGYPGLSADSISAILTRAAADSLLPDMLRQRVLFELNSIQRNRIGASVPDFSFTDRSGKQSSLYAFDSGSAPILIIFFDPDCEHCREVISEIDSDPDISEAVADGRLAILAVYPDGDPELFSETCHALPSHWTVALDTSGIQGNDLIDIPYTPTLLLLSPTHTILIPPSPHLRCRGASSLQ